MPATMPADFRSWACLNSASAVACWARVISTRLLVATDSRYRFTATSTTRSRAVLTPYFSAWRFSAEARASFSAAMSITGCERYTRASCTLNGPTIGGLAGKPNASRLMTCRRLASDPETLGSSSASARHRAPRAEVSDSSCSSRPRLFSSARWTASFTESGSGSAVTVPFAMLPRNGLADACWRELCAVAG
jgi:hypothetical protein